MKRRYGDFRYIPSVRKMRESHMRLFRLAVAKNKRAYFYRTRYWELHFRHDDRTERILKRENTENKRLEHRCAQEGKRIAYVRCSMWSFHSGDSGFKTWLIDENGKWIADVPSEIAWPGSDSGICLFAATLGYDEILNAHSHVIITE